MTPQRLRRAPAIATVLLSLCPGAAAQDTNPVAGSRDVLSTLPVDRIALPLGSSGREMEVAVYVPHTYDPASTYPVLVIPDADPLMGLLQTVSFLWAEERSADPAILVGLPFGATAGAIWTNRTYYLLPDSVGVVDYYGEALPVNNGGGAPELARFLREQVLPMVRERYAVDPGRLGLAGFSMGGLFAAWHLVTHPGVFSDYIIVAPPLDAPFVGPEFDRATSDLHRGGFARPTHVFVSYAEDDLAAVKAGAPRWIERWLAVDDDNLSFRFEEISGLRHDGGAIPALISGYSFLYGR